MCLASAYALLGRVEDAKSEAAEVQTRDPSFSGCDRGALPFKDAAALARLAEGLRKAGLPE